MSAGLHIVHVSAPGPSSEWVTMALGRCDPTVQIQHVRADDAVPFTIPACDLVLIDDGCYDDSVLRSGAPVVVLSTQAALTRSIALVRAGVFDVVSNEDAERLTLVVVRRKSELDRGRAGAEADSRAASIASHFQFALDAAQMVSWELDLASERLLLTRPPEPTSPRRTVVHEGSIESLYALLHPDDRNRAREALRRTVEEGGRYECEYRVSSADGTWRWIEATGCATRDSSGEVVSVFGVTQDVTARRVLEREREEALAKYRTLFEALRDSELRRALAVEAAQIGTWELDLESGEVIWSGCSFEEVWGEVPKDFAAFTRRIHPDDVAEMSRLDAEARSSREVFGLEYRVTAPDGRLHWFSSRGGHLFDAEGAVVRVVGVMFDVTARKEAELALRESEAELRMMFDTAAIGAAQVDVATGKLVRVNRKLCEITGYSEEELLQRCFFSLTHPDDRAAFREGFRRAVAGQTASRVEKRYVRKGGLVAWVRVSVSILRDEAGLPIRSLALIDDITDRRRAEEDRARLAAAVEQAAESIVVLDRAGTILYANPSYERATGQSRTEAVGQNLRLAQRGDPVHEQMWTSLSRGEVWRGRLANRRADGSIFHENVTCSPIRDATRNVVAYVAIKLDVTREMELEASLRQSQKLEALGQLAGGVAHDFNNILGAMVLQVDLLLSETTLDEDSRTALADLGAYARRAGELTRQLLLFSRRSVMVVDRLDLNALVSNLLKMLVRIVGEQVAIEFEASEIPGVEADAGMLEQVVLNLVVNARDAMPAGGVIVLATTVLQADLAARVGQAERHVGSFVCLSVRDTGTGMDPATRKRVFEPFFTTKEVGKGTGLGLATVHGIIAQHGGWIEVESEVGQGSVFRVMLPVATKTATRCSAPRLESPLVRRGGEFVMVVEDEPELRKLVMRSLLRQGYRVAEAFDGPSALLAWADLRSRGELPDILVTDMVLPSGMTGLAIAGRLRQEAPSLSVIVTSGYSADLSESGPLDGVAFLGKPYSLAALARTVRETLDRAMA